MMVIYVVIFTIAYGLLDTYADRLSESNKK